MESDPSSNRQDPKNPSNKAPVPSKAIVDVSTPVELESDSRSACYIKPTVTQVTFLKGSAATEQSSKSPKHAIEVATVYLVNAQIGADPTEMHVKIVTVDTTTGRAQIKLEWIQKNYCHLIEPCKNIVIRSGCIYS